MKRYFITATGTDIGKTLVTCALTWQLRAKSKIVKALKPIVSGFDNNIPEHSDTAQLLATQGLTLTEIDAISPWRFTAPLSPDMAARMEERVVHLDDVVRFCNHATIEDYIFIEGVGGVMSPINNHHTVLDWMEALAIPVVLVTGSYVGTISHTLTALHALKSRSLLVQCIIINASQHSDASVQETQESLQNHMHERIPLHIINRLDSAQEIWKNAPDITQGLEPGLN